MLHTTAAVSCATLCGKRHRCFITAMHRHLGGHPYQGSADWPGRGQALAVVDLGVVQPGSPDLAAQAGGSNCKRFMRAEAEDEHDGALRVSLACGDRWQRHAVCDAVARGGGWGELMAGGSGGGGGGGSGSGSTLERARQRCSMGGRQPAGRQRTSSAASSSSRRSCSRSRPSPACSTARKGTAL